jgi:hypothetical protein
MFRILRAFAWMRWRVLINSLERTGARDTLERLSLAVGQLGPIIAALVFVPSLLALSALSAFAGHSVAAGPDRPITFEILRYLTLAISGVAVIGPIVIPVMERANPVRLMLLPIPRATLYVAQAAASIADPWTLLMVPIVLFLPLGLAVGGAAPAAALSFGAGLILLVVLVGLSTLTACLVQLVVRDRRRGELVALAFILIIPLTGMLVGLLDHNGSRARRRTAAPAQVEPAAGAGLAGRLGRGAFALTPSEQYVGATRAGVQGRPATGAARLVALAAIALGLHGGAFLAFQQLLAFPGSVARRRSGRRTTVATRRVPGLSPGASAVATAHLRLALRTPRGRSTLLSPILVFTVFAVVSSSSGASLSIVPESGLGLAAFGAMVSLMATLPFSMNQFAVDGAGLTLELLSPLSESDLLDGKAVANGLIAGAPALVCLAVAFLLLPGGAATLWISVPLATAAVHLLIAPAAAAISAIFPRAVDLNSVGRGSNAHGVAGLLGVATIVFAALPPAGLVLVANGWLKRPELTPVLLLGWCAVAFGVNRLLSRLVRPLLAARRENLGLVAG